MSDYLQITTGVPASTQSGAFMNATQQTTETDLSVSIAIHLPDHMQDLLEDELATLIKQELLPLAQVGWQIEVQIGPDDE
ncbi:hypothetical protein [Sphingomonas jaspsi]|uniref:hypothetical protein n=1 Tax=Sphingomonas jaspsi TaxID=392409 RepID=UPI00055F798B|nr:hypothetical protein [Sphingomonas jaspsi]